MFTYRTYFNLTMPVTDIDDARDYLTEDDMTVYLKEDLRLPKSLNEVIVSINWILRDEESGYIDLITTRELDTTELKFISDWVRGQNSDGLGEGFSQQSFSNYNMAEYESYEYDEDDWIEDWVIAEFDWQTNDYKFELVSSN